mgnify:CR=1 FL=1
MKLITSVVCDDLSKFQSVLKKLSELGYVDGRPGQIGANVYTLGMSQYHFTKCGIRIINLYDNKTIKYACYEKKLKNLITAIDFLKN